MQEIPLPQGFRAAGVHCGIKDDPQQRDLALFVSDRPASAAGVFTQNRVCGAPVKVSRARLPRATARGVVVSSGNANACTGERGLEDARWMTWETAQRLGCEAEDLLVCSTGVIGRFLPRETLAAGIPAVVETLGERAASFADAARGMMTTDTVPKQSVREAELAGHRVRVAGAAKGAAMIAPNMATMLAVMMTDAALSPDEADAMLRASVDRSFNCITVEGHTSTSDSVVLLANGAAGTGLLSEGDRNRLQEMLDATAEELARAIVRDAEGAGHFVTLDVRGLKTREEARRIAKVVAEGTLVKTALAGADPNWGRIVSAVGYSGVEVAEEEITLRINGATIYRAGAPVDYDERRLAEQMRADRDVHIELELTRGREAVRFWTCDLTQEYVRLNSEKTT